MNQLCRVCSEPAAGFHFGAFTCEGCKSFFGRTCNNVSALGDCKNGDQCVINRKNRTACKSCRLSKCLKVGMSKSGSRYGRRSNWFKIHCLMQDQNQTSEASATLEDPDRRSPPSGDPHHKSPIKTECPDVRPAGTSSPSISSSDTRVPSDEMNILEFLSAARAKLLLRYGNLETPPTAQTLPMMAALSPFLFPAIQTNHVPDLSSYCSLLSLVANSQKPMASPPAAAVSIKRKAEVLEDEAVKVARLEDLSEQQEPMDLSVKGPKMNSSVLSCSMTLTTIKPYPTFQPCPPTEIPTTEPKPPAGLDLSCSG